jgi:hypothetical protein
MKRTISEDTAAVTGGPGEGGVHPRVPERSVRFPRGGRPGKRVA